MEGEGVATACGFVQRAFVGMFILAFIRLRGHRVADGAGLGRLGCSRLHRLCPGRIAFGPFASYGGLERGLSGRGRDLLPRRPRLGLLDRYRLVRLLYTRLRRLRWGLRGRGGGFSP